MLCQPRPDYPKAAASRGVQGTSIIDLEFAADGTLAMARIAVPSGASPEHTLLDEAALAAVQRCRLARAEPAPTTRRITYSWKLDEGGTTADYMKELERAQRERLAIQAADDARLSIDAEHGVAVAQLALARQYADGERRERNDKLASTWFRKARRLRERRRHAARRRPGRALVPAGGSPQLRRALPSRARLP